MSLFNDASSRPWRVVAVVVLGLAVSMTTATPASAASADCEGVRRQVAERVFHEATSGVPSGFLEHLRSLGPSLIGCDRDDLDGYQGMGNDTEQWRPLVALYFDPEDVDRAMCLMEKESDGNPEARNPSTGAAGLMQVMPFWAETHGYDYEVLFNPAVNLWIAGQIRDQQGWHAWSPYLRGECR
ncbi:MAG: lytic transglycosylase domain-containing protein [Acidimicrobiia bacterium]